MLPVSDTQNDSLQLLLAGRGCLAVEPGKTLPPGFASQQSLWRALVTDSRVPVHGQPLQVRGAGRRLLSDCDVVGSVGKGGSIVILLLIGFIVGAGFSWLIFWRRERRQRRIEVGPPCALMHAEAGATCAIIAPVCQRSALLSLMSLHRRECPTHGSPLCGSADGVPQPLWGLCEA